MSSNYVYPFEGQFRVSSPYGNRTSPITGAKEFHSGTDLVGITNKTIYAVADAYVRFAGDVPKNPNNPGDLTYQWGNYVRLDEQSNDKKWFNCHMEKVLVKSGQYVKAGDPIGIMGSTGLSTGEHLHIECRTISTNKVLNSADILGIPNVQGTIINGKENDTMGRTIVANGIDVSKYQGNINFAQVKAAGYSFVLVRAVSSNNAGVYIDPYFNQNVKNAQAAGLNVGAYFFTYATNKAYMDKELNLFIQAIKQYRLTMPVIVDVESTQTASIGKAACTDLVKYALDKLQSMNYYVMWYTYTNYANSYLDRSKLSAYDCWIADYRGYVGYTGSYNIWQYSSTKKVPGVSGNCDANYSYMDFPSVIAKNNLYGNGSGEVTPPSTEINWVENNGKYKLEVTSGKCEYFNALDVYAVAGKLPMGSYDVTRYTANEYNGYKWVQFYYIDRDWFAVLLDDRSILVESEEYDPKDDEIADLKNQLLEVTEQKNELEQKLQAAESTIEDLKNESNAQIDELKKTYEAKITELNNQIADLVKQLDQYKDDAEKYQTLKKFLQDMLAE